MGKAVGRFGVTGQSSAPDGRSGAARRSVLAFVRAGTWADRAAPADAAAPRPPAGVPRLVRPADWSQGTRREWRDASVSFTPSWPATFPGSTQRTRVLTESGTARLRSSTWNR